MSPRTRSRDRSRAAPPPARPAAAPSESPAPPPAPSPSEQPMSQEQAVRLKALAGQALEPEAFRPRLTQAEAARRIRALEVKLSKMDGPPHTM